MSHRVKWNFEAVKVEAAKYPSSGEFRKGNTSAYQIAYRKGWLNLLIFEEGKKLTRWTFERIKEEASKYRTREEFQKGSGGAYHRALKMGCLDELGLAKPYSARGPTVWTFDAVREAALGCTSRKQLENKNQNAYHAALRYKWMDELFPKK